jgi:hypothetical protein
MQRTHMSTNAVAYVNQLCKRADAKIVTNSAHNYYNTDMGDLKTDLIIHGIKKEYFHEDWRTDFAARGTTGSDYNSMKGVDNWIKKHGDVDWICFDDFGFTTMPNLILVDFNHGISYDEYVLAREKFNYEDGLIFW